MSDGVLSQEEINALLSGGVDALQSDSSGSSGASGATEDSLTQQDMDAIGEVANISMGTAATTLFNLLNQKVDISTPVVTECVWDDIVDSYERPCVFIKIAYTVGLDGSNILVLKEKDVKIITDLMMGGDGSNTDGELSELHLSAISEAMNQMMGSSATSLSSMLNTTIDISPPVAEQVDLQGTIDEGAIDNFLTGKFVRITFKMAIGDLIDSEIMQLYPHSFARKMVESFLATMNASIDDSVATSPETPADTPPAPAAAPPPSAPPPQPAPDMSGGQMMGQMDPSMMGGQMMGQPMMGAPMMGQPMMGAPMMGQPMMGAPMMMPQGVNVQPAQFSGFTGEFSEVLQKENIDLIMDVPLDVTVELGRTTKSIQDILDFAPGTIIELNKIAGEPIDIVVNGKYVAKGEVVVIEESFGVRITEILTETKKPE